MVLAFVTFLAGCTFGQMTDIHHFVPAFLTFLAFLTKSRYILPFKLLCFFLLGGPYNGRIPRYGHFSHLPPFSSLSYKIKYNVQRKLQWTLF